ncbi:MAG: peptidoglycan-binding protein, partial [Ruminococcaceae bacterium]|nr:peptidoglycan-binding protein [Oscillospiraceae bacterium]
DYYETVNPITVDGIFGARTKEAVTAFQFAQNLSADGIIGQQTWNRLYRLYYSVNNGLTISAPYPGSALTIGSVGSNVALMQRYLNYIRSFYTSIPEITIDSQFGNATRTAVMAFQRLFGLTADGIIGRQTWSAIVAVYDRVVVYI